MLRGTRSLAFRASLIFASVYAAIFLAVIVISAVFSWADRSEGNQLGPVLARDYASADIRDGPQGLKLSAHGEFADLAARNPSIWLIIIKDGRTFTFGRVTPVALRTVSGLRSVSDVALFRVPGASMPLAGGAIRQVEFPDGLALVAAGGVDPNTLSARETMQLLRDPTVAAMLAAIAFLSVLGMIAAARVFSRVLGPITAEAAAIGPTTSGSRLTEAKTPMELLPLVRSFNAALDRLDRELGRRKRFITDVAHELRTPLAVVTLQADSLPRVEGKADLQRGLGRMTRLLGHMLDLERLTIAARAQEDVDLTVIARDSVADLAPMALDRGYALSLDAPRDPVLVTADPHAVARAIVNLIGNALAHGGNRGEIRVQVRADRTIEVADEGPGIPPELRRRLFEPFSRGHSGEDGSGLGLHLAREIMRAHGGDISLLDSETGAIFRLSFPEVRSVDRPPAAIDQGHPRDPSPC